MSSYDPFDDHPVIARLYIFAAVIAFPLGLTKGCLDASGSIKKAEGEAQKLSEEYNNQEKVLKAARAKTEVLREEAALWQKKQRESQNWKDKNANPADPVPVTTSTWKRERIDGKNTKKRVAALNVRARFC